MIPLEELKDWELDRLLEETNEGIEYTRQDFYDLNIWNALPEDMDDCQARLEELVVRKGQIRAEIARRRPNTKCFT